jgi:hypothetical protein
VSWQSGHPCTDCGCDAFMDTPAGRLHAHLADGPRLDVTRLRRQLAGAVADAEALRERLAIAEEICRVNGWPEFSS